MEQRYGIPPAPSEMVLQWTAPPPAAAMQHELGQLDTALRAVCGPFTGRETLRWFVVLTVISNSNQPARVNFGVNCEHPPQLNVPES